MAFGSYGTEAIARRKRVYYTGTSTIYEGMALCYDWDTTTSRRSLTTIAEGSQCDGKYMDVEDPATANLQWFAGVVADGTWIGSTGPKWLDIYVPNGAVVPVRTDQNCTVGVTVLGVANGNTSLTVGGRPVAVALETVDRSTDGITLAKLDPNQFVYGYNGSEALSLGAGTDNRIFDFAGVTTAQTGGYGVGSQRLVTASGTVASTGGFTAYWGYVDVSGSITATTSYTRAVIGQLNLSGTINGSNAHLCGVFAQLSGSPTFTECSKVAGLMVDLSLGVAPTTGDYVGIHIANNGANQTQVDDAIEIYGGYGINRLFSFQSCDGITANFISDGGTGDTTLTTGDDWKKIKIKIGSTDYYLIAMNDPAES